MPGEGEILKVMTHLSNITSDARAKASRKNGKLGGRPEGSKDKKPRVIKAKRGKATRKRRRKGKG